MKQKTFPDIDGKRYPMDMLYYQPIVGDNRMVDKDGAEWPSFAVWKDKKKCQKLFPKSKIGAYKNDEIQEPMFSDDIKSSDYKSRLTKKAKPHWVHTASIFQGDIHGPYDNADEAGQAVARLAIAAFNLNDDVQRSYTIIEAATKEKAEEEINRKFGDVV